VVKKVPASAKKSVAKSPLAKSPLAKKSAVKKVATKNVAPASHRFPTKAELEALKLAREAEELAKEERKAAHRFPTKAELAARKASIDAEKNPPKVTSENASKPVLTKIDGEEVELEDIELEDLSKIKDIEDNEIIGFDNGRELDDKQYGDDLDVPGSDLDDDEEKIGNEDEENNYYSIGGDEHNDLTENQGD
jgi:hypothetical protein